MDGYAIKCDVCGAMNDMNYNSCINCQLPLEKTKHSQVQIKSDPLIERVQVSPIKAESTYAPIKTKDDSIIPIYKWFFLMLLCSTVVGAIYISLYHDDTNVQNFCRALLILIIAPFILVVVLSVAIASML